jgi:hypothetical protein
MFGRLVSLLSVFALATASIKDCSSGMSVLQLTDLALLPDPPVRNQPLDMTVKFNNPGEEIVDGTVTTSVTLNFIPFQPTVEPLCTNTQCPLVPGANDRSTSSTWPDNVSGNIQSKIEWTAVDGTQLLCIQINARVGVTNSSLRGRLPSYNQTTADELALIWSWGIQEGKELLPYEVVSEEPFAPWANCSLEEPWFVKTWPLNE